MRLHAVCPGFFGFRPVRDLQLFIAIKCVNEPSSGQSRGLVLN